MDRSNYKRLVVITGGSSGIGKALAKGFIGECARVVIMGREIGALKKCSEELGSDFAQVDVRDGTGRLIW